MKKPVSLSLVFILAVCAVARAQPPENELAAGGRDFALHVCANCHVVENGQKAPILKPPAPSFASILVRPEVDEAWLRKFLSTPHRNLGRGAKMPNPELAAFQVDKLLAYLLQVKSSQAAH